MFDGQEIIAEIKGRNLVTGLPQKISIRRTEIEEALYDTAMQIVHAVQSVLEITPPELIVDIHTNGLIMTGGGAMLNGLDRLLAHHTKLKTIIPPNSIECVAIGTGKSFKYIDKLVDGFVNPSIYSRTTN